VLDEGGKQQHRCICSALKWVRDNRSGLYCMALPQSPICPAPNKCRFFISPSSFPLNFIYGFIGPLWEPSIKLSEVNMDTDSNISEAGDSIVIGTGSKRLDRRQIYGAPRFACPFYVRNHTNHTTWRACAGPGWPAVHRVKLVVYSILYYLLTSTESTFIAVTSYL
jgi:hypothetical protein